MSSISADLNEVITSAYWDAAAFHGNLGVPLAVWKARVAEILRKCLNEPAGDGAAAFAERLHNRDLYLATCCAEHHDAAWQRFESLYQKYIDELVRSFARNTVHATDISEELVVDLFLPDRSGRSRIASYDGRSSLATWLHVIIAHRVTNERVRKWNNLERPGEMPEVPDAPWVAHVDAQLNAERYGAAIEASLRSACSGLSRRDSRMLVWRYHRGLLLEDIAKLLSVHPSTVCRQLERVTERLRRDMVESLTRTHGFSAAAIAECLSELTENGPRCAALLHIIRQSLAADADEPGSDARTMQIA